MLFAITSRGVPGGVTRLPGRGDLGRSCSAAGRRLWTQAARGTVRLRVPASLRFPGPRSDRGGGDTVRGLGWAEEVEPEVFPVPVSVRGAAAAAAGAEMPKGGEGRARVARGPRGATRVRLPLTTQPAGASESGVREGVRAG